MRAASPWTLPADPPTPLSASTRQYCDGQASGLTASILLNRTNGSPNPNGAAGVTGYSAKTDTFTGITAAPTQGAAGANGSTSCVQFAVANSGSGEVYLPTAAVTPGSPYTTSVYVNVPAGAIAVLSANWFNSGAYSSTSVAPSVTPSAARQPTTGGFVRLSFSVTVPAGVNQIAPYVSFYGLTSGQTVQLSQNLDEAVAGAGSYFDGGFSGCAWTGTVGASTSTYSLRAALAAIAVATIGAANGVAPLDASAFVPIANLPVGTTAATVAGGNDSRIVNAVPRTRQVASGVGVTGGGDLSADLSLSVAYGNTGSTALQGNDVRNAPGVSDALIYQDYFTTMPRVTATFSSGNSKTLASGTIYATGGVAEIPFLARVLRFANALTAGTGGNLMFGLYTGTGPGALTRQATITTMTSTTASTLYEQTLSATYGITAGMFVYIFVLSTMTTAPNIASLNGAQGMIAGFLNPNAAHYFNMTYGTAGQTALPATANLQTGWTTSALPFWGALSV